MKGVKYIIILLVLLLIVSLVGVFYLYTKITKTPEPTKETLLESQKIMSEVGEVIMLPKDEVPAIATVADPAKLQDQSFFANAKEGDKVLIYQKSKKVILWRPSTKKIIEVSYFDADQQDNITEVSTTTQAENTEQN